MNSRRRTLSPEPLYRHLRQVAVEQCFCDYRVTYGNVRRALGHVCFCRIADLCSSDKMAPFIKAVRSGSFDKTELPMFTPLGLFTTSYDPRRFSLSGRSEDDWRAPSGLVVMDWDYIPSDRISALRQDLESRPEITAILTSPSGRGLKIFAKMDVEGGATPLDAPRMWEAFSTFVDPTEDIPRTAPPGSFVNDSSAGRAPQPLFLTWDPEAYINLDSIPLPTLPKGQEWKRPEYGDYRMSLREWMLKIAMVASEQKLPYFTMGAKQRLVCPACRYQDGSLVLFQHRDGHYWLRCHYRECDRLRVPESLDDLRELLPGISTLFDQEDELCTT